MNKEKSSRLVGELLLFLTAMIWGLSFVAQSVGAGEIGPLTFTCLRNVLGLLVIAPFAVPAYRKSASARTEDKKGSYLAGVLKGGALCGLFLFGGLAPQQYSLGIIDPGKAAFITALYIILVPVFSLFLGKRSGVRTWVCVVMGAVALYLLCSPGISGSPDKRELLGDAAATVGAVFFALQIIALDHYLRSYDALTLSVVQYAVCALISFVPMVIIERPSLSSLSAATVPLLYTGIMSTGVAFTLQCVGQKRTDPVVASLIMCFESVFSVLFSALILKTRMSVRETVGCAVMFAAMVLINLPSIGAIKKKLGRSA